ncbi:hypothetical protein [Pseudoalteromonas shioyasakiensis]|uniref:hypothetical protein n=1 Tax=Pseudoalteromonas shioyasakiensis TaxID=1190813 RepID=UPI001C3E69E6|nr:hypothetical protein [Pseudoalteromonas shioyasakiensis]
MTNSNVVELFQKRPAVANDEECIALYEQNNDYIYYVRNYVAQQEFIVVSDSFIQALPEEMRPATNVFFSCNFCLLKQFKQLVQSHILNTGQFLYFYHLFDKSVNAFFDSL